MSLYEIFHGEIPDLSSFKIIGARCEVLNEKLPKSAKIQPRSETQFSIGFTKTRYCVYEPFTKKTTEVCHMKIFKDEFFKDVYDDSDVVDKSLQLVATENGGADNQFLNWCRSEFVCENSSS